MARRRNGFIGLAAVLMAGFAGTVGAGPALEEPELPGLSDRPGEAAEWYRAKRVPVGDEEVPVERYVAALKAMREMPQHSTGLGKLLPSRSEIHAKRLDSAVEAAALGAWQPLGPGNIGGRTRALLIDPRRPATMYAAGASGGVFKTTDSGTHWVPLTDLLANLAVVALTFDPRNPDILYAGTGEGFGTADALRGVGIFRSTNGGTTWTRLPGTEGDGFAYVNDLALSRRSGKLYAATSGGVWRGTLSGTAWRFERILSTDLQRGCLDLALRPDRPDDVLLVSCGLLGQGVVFRNAKAQTGTAAGWRQVLAEVGMSRTTLAIAPSNPDIVYALSAFAGPSQPGKPVNGVFALYRSARGGEPGSWVAQLRAGSPDRLSTALLSYATYTFLGDCGLGPNNVDQGLGWYTNVLAVDPADPNRVWAGGVDLYRSDDGGRSFGLASYWWPRAFFQEALPPGPITSYVHADNHVLAFDPRYDGRTNKTLYVGDDGGLFRTKDARAAVARGARAACDPRLSKVVWEDLNHGYAVTQFYHGTPFPDGRRYAGGTQDNGMVMGEDARGANGWQVRRGGDAGYVLVDPTDPRIVYSALTNASLQKSTDGGVTFAEPGPPLSNGFFLFITPYALDPNDSHRLWTGGDALWRSDDGAASWHKASPLLLPAPNSAFPLGQVSALGIFPSFSNRVLAGTTEGTIFRTEAALTAGEATVWDRARPRAGWVSSVVLDPRQLGVVYATYSTFGGTHVWKSGDGGATWGPLDGSGPANRRLPDVPVHALAVDPIHPGRLYAGTDLGVFTSLDGGATWAVEATGFANVVVESLAIQTGPPGTATLFAFTYGRGAYRIRL